MRRLIITFIAIIVWVAAVVGLIAYSPLGELTYLLAMPTSATITLIWVWAWIATDRYYDHVSSKES